MVKLGKLNVKDISPQMKQHVHGTHSKNLVVLHETVSGDIPGWTDINSIAQYLAAKDYGIHGLTDKEGNIAWAYGLGNAIFWHAGGVNTSSMGIENVSRVMLQAPTNVARRKLWVARDAQLKAIARLLAAIHRTHPHIPLKYSDSRTAGITTHWDVSQFHKESDGHTDCWPLHKGGYFPVLDVIQYAKAYYLLGLA